MFDSRLPKGYLRRSHSCSSLRPKRAANRWQSHSYSPSLFYQNLFVVILVGDREKVTSLVIGVLKRKDIYNLCMPIVCLSHLLATRIQEILQLVLREKIVTRRIDKTTIFLSLSTTLSELRSIKSRNSASRSLANCSVSSDHSRQEVKPAVQLPVQFFFNTSSFDSSRPTYSWTVNNPSPF